MQKNWRVIDRLSYAKDYTGRVSYAPTAREKVTNLNKWHSLGWQEIVDLCWFAHNYEWEIILGLMRIQPSVRNENDGEGLTTFTWKVAQMPRRNYVWLHDECSFLTKQLWLHLMTRGWAAILTADSRNFTRLSNFNLIEVETFHGS